ncbi:transglutaminase family protein [Olivibacter sitiensis]|uniref:transglutaminase family protein n=1 Tax=Olivibacter sitiensis TaxID=376470 RepID=UPI0003FE2A77|nr:transglutaminase family protein [Olivibacter sitiensis]
MPIFSIVHTTKYEYENPVVESMNEIRIFPYKCPDQEVLQHELNISYSPLMHTFYDYWRNKVGTFSISHPHKELVIENKLLIRTTMPNLLQINFHSGFDELNQEMQGQLKLLELSRPDKIDNKDSLNELLSTISDGSHSIAMIVERTSDVIYKKFRYVKGITSIETTVDEILLHGGGVCQDFAHLMLQLLRSMSIPARYVSGYICPNKNGMRGEGATHAWVEAYIPGYGWTGIDPTNNTWVTNAHVKLALGRNFRDCTPVKGTFRGNSKQHLSVNVSIGYEDGNSFQETNDVQTQVNIRPMSEIDIHMFGSQQQ